MFSVDAYTEIDINNPTEKMRREIRVGGSTAKIGDVFQVALGEVNDNASFLWQRNERPGAGVPQLQTDGARRGRSSCPRT